MWDDDKDGITSDCGFKYFKRLPVWQTEGFKNS